MQYSSGYGQQQQPQFPVPVDTFDPNTFNHQLPQGNDVWPRITPPPHLPTPLVEAIVSEFRLYAQFRVDRTPLNTLTYNLFAQNYFDNPYYTEWVQRVCDFTEFLVVTRNQQHEVAKDKAISMVFGGAMATNAAQYPALFQALNQQAQNALIEAGNIIGEIDKDLDMYIRNGRRPPMAQGYGGGHAPARINTTIGQGTIPSGQGARTHHGGVAQTSTSVATVAPAGGRYTTISWDANTPTEVSGRQETVVGRSGYVKQPSKPVVEVEENVTVPSSKDELMIDPYAYIPKGVEIDPERPYDVIYAPGGIEIRPYHLSPYTRTKNDITPYAQGYDPALYCLFHIRWPDGMIEEHLVSWDTSMEMSYLKHEINAKLRGTAIQPNGGKHLASSSLKILNLEGETTSLADMAPKVEDEQLSVREMSPVFIETVFTGSTDAENEDMARDVLIDTLKLENEDSIPAHEYVTQRLYPLDVDAECQVRLLALSDSESLTHVAKGLSEAVADGCLPLRYFRIINNRLTEYINTCLSENLTSTIQIDSFVEDIRDLFDLLRSKGQTDAVENIVARATSILKRVMNIQVNSSGEEDEDDQLYLIDEYINIQTGWSSEQLVSLNLDTEPTLVSKATHPKVHKVLDAALKRHSDNDTLVGRQVRVITSDGVYLEAMKGWLVGGSLLVKKLK